jgi:hypothetical protein
VNCATTKAWNADIPVKTSARQEVMAAWLLEKDGEKFYLIVACGSD